MAGRQQGSNEVVCVRELLRDMVALIREWGRFVIAPGAIPFKVALDRAIELEEACMRIAALTGNDVDEVKRIVMSMADSWDVMSAAEVAARMEVDAMMGRE